MLDMASQDAVWHPSVKKSVISIKPEFADKTSPNSAGQIGEVNDRVPEGQV